MLQSCEYEMCTVDMAQINDELQRWYDECQRSHTLNSDIRLAMLECFQDIILNAIVEED